MRIEPALAETIAHAAIGEPYRQTDLMTTREVEAFLRTRDLHLSWESIHHLWLRGVLHPVAVLEEAADGLLERERLVRVDVRASGVCYVDLGTGAVPPELLRATKFGYGLSSALLWHPFQLWMFCSLERALKVSIAPIMTLRGSAAAADLVRFAVEDRLPAMHDLGGGARHHHFLRLLALLLLAEPLVHPSVFGSIRARPAHNETFEGYAVWRRGQDAAGYLRTAGLTVEEAVEWHTELSLSATLDDPNESLRALLRLVPHRERDRLKGASLRAHTLYDVAETLRRYLEQYHGLELPEEDDVRHGPRSPAVKEQRYGARRTTDAERAVRRRIARHFGVDPQARLTWFVEGDTEVAFLRRMADHLGTELVEGGIELVNLYGLGGLAGRQVRQLLERLRREEVFAFVAVDEDRRGDHLRQLRKMAEEGLVPAGFRVWRPDFETANFTLEELADFAISLASQHGVTVQLGADDIRREMADRRKGAGDAAVALLGKVKVYVGKGQEWGTALADWVSGQEAPLQLAGQGENRPITALLVHLLQGEYWDYRHSVQSGMVDEDGEIVQRPAPQVP